MKNRKGEVQRKRIIIYYVLAIVLPCLILGILAFRGIKNDQALVEREQRRNLLEAGQQIFRDTDTYLSSIENGIAEIIDSIATPQNKIFTDSTLGQFCTLHQEVAGVFLISERRNPSILSYGLLYVPDNYLTAPDVTEPQSRHFIWEEGWQFEFREMDYRKALEYYRGILPNVTGKQEGGEILNAIARVQKKLQLDDEALETYDLIWKNYPQVLIQHKIPLGAVALMEKSLLYLKKKDTIPALKTVGLLLDQIQKPLWVMGHSPYANFLSNIEEIISRCDISSNKETNRWLDWIRSEKDRLSLSEDHTEYVLAFMENIEMILDDSQPGWQNADQRHKTSINDNSYLFTLLPAGDEEQWGLIMDPGHILHDTVHQLILKNANESSFYWEVKGGNGELLLASSYLPEDVSPLYVMSPSTLPSWTLTLYPEASGLLVSVFRGGEGIFIFIFIVILIILAAVCFLPFKP